ILNDKYQLQVNSLVEIKAELERLEKRLEDVAWLEENAQMQRENIDNYVYLEKFLFSRIDTQTIPKLILVAEIRNTSYFEVELETPLKGLVEFDVLTLRGHTYINEYSLSVIPPLRAHRFTIEAEITKEQQEYIESFPKEHKIPIEKGLIIHKLVLTIKGAYAVSQIIPKPLKIRNGFKIFNGKEYERALEQFSQ
ncbi:MAG TPA: hypothetical protein VK400_10600, partial [Pyrinomonadaceae bacterium]|nr:hypothetical protein [Pyrinomonadaceae bacterium]